MDQLGTLFGLLFLIIGPVALGYAVVAYFRTTRFLRCCTEVQGEVVRLERSEDRTGTENYISYAPVFSFTAVDGKNYKVTSNISSSPADFSVGEQVRVRYDPANPEDARIHTFFQTWGGVILSSIIGAGFIGFALYQLGYLHLLNHGWSGR